MDMENKFFKMVLRIRAISATIKEMVKELIKMKSKDIKVGGKMVKCMEMEKRPPKYKF
jgi:hypothetical protein